jgi:hypothetical protein
MAAMAGATEDQTKYEPSESLRSLIAERAQEQHTCLSKEMNKLSQIVDAANQGDLAVAHGGKKSQGDQQISAATVKQITSSLNSGSFAAVPAYGLPCASVSEALAAAPSSGWTFETSTEPRKCNDPMARYQQLEGEITMLMRLIDPQFGLENYGFPTKHPRKLRNMLLENLVGPPGKMGSDDSDDDDTMAAEDSSIAGSAASLNPGAFAEGTPPMGP